MRFKSLDAWLDWQQCLNPESIQLGLERVQQVYVKLNIEKIADRVITVAGTNGKGSTVAYYETWLNNSGYRVASYTSPHLIKYNERIKLNLQPVSDDSLCEAFAVIDEVRGNVPLTYFEFGTLAALYLINRFKPDVAILEVGLGGRLDAVNIIDADIAHLTPIGLDHQDWLGDSVDSIAYEKAGILRQNGKVICNMHEVPESLNNELMRQNSQTSLLGRDYNFTALDDGFIQWTDEQYSFHLKPPLQGRHQALNLSGVLAGLSLSGLLESHSELEITSAFDSVSCPGRLQKIDSDLAAQLWLDVGHNEDAATVLAQAVSDMHIRGKVVVLLGMLADKNPASFVSQLKLVVDEWWVLDLTGDRGLSAKELAEKIVDVVPVTHIFEYPEKSIEHAVLSLSNQDILLVTGSFMTVEAILATV